MPGGLKKIQQILSQPFPNDSSFSSELKGSLAIGSFVFIFLFLFEPFGLSQAGSKVLIFSAYFGLATAGVSLFSNLFIDHVLKIDREASSWTFAKWLISVLFTIILIALANYFILSTIYQGISFSLPQLLKIAYITFLVGMFPVGFLGYIHLNRSRMENEAFAHNFKVPDAGEDLVQLNIDQDSNSELILDQEDFLFAEAMQNYMAVYYLEGERVEKNLIRMTLKELESKIGNERIVRCHRSFIANLRNIESISGNAQGLKLKIKNTDRIIPVSRSYIKLFK